MIAIRVEQTGDEDRVHEINVRAFGESELGHHGEAQLVDRLRASCPNHISLVAELEGEVVGHILFTPAVIAGDDQETHGMGLAPMSVLPGLQRRGVGSRLVEAGLEAVRRGDSRFVMVLGHPEYYPRFGFEPASIHGITCEFEGIPAEHFMIWFPDDKADRHSGIAKYRPEFRE